MHKDPLALAAFQGSMASEGVLVFVIVLTALLILMIYAVVRAPAWQPTRPPEGAGPRPGDRPAPLPRRRAPDPASRCSSPCPRPRPDGTQVSRRQPATGRLVPGRPRGAGPAPGGRGYAGRPGPDHQPGGAGPAGAGASRGDRPAAVGPGPAPAGPDLGARGSRADGALPGRPGHGAAQAGPTNGNDGTWSLGGRYPAGEPEDACGTSEGVGPRGRSRRQSPAGQAGGKAERPEGLWPDGDP